MSLHSSQKWWKTEDPNLRGLSKLLTGAQVHTSWCTGIVPTSPTETKIFFEGRDKPGILRFDSPSSNSLDELSAVCDAATFGRNAKDVLDENYRKAGKLDVGKFAWCFSPDNSKIKERLMSELMSSSQADRGVRFELYKLNVYGKGCFFKAHKDTPRHETMFGSLVLILPTPHEGGKLLLRHSSQETEFDAASMLKGTNTLSIAYAAFYSDVEHEVTEVTAGHRVTITYNLYFTSQDRTGSSEPSKESGSASEAEKKSEPSMKLNGRNRSEVKDPKLARLHEKFYTRRGPAYEPPPSPPPRLVDTSSVPTTFEFRLAQLLDDLEFLPNGGLLGFGLQHSYPISKIGREIINFGSILKNLKGADAILANACARMSLKHSLRVVYRSAGMIRDSEWAVMATKIFKETYPVEDPVTALTEADDKARVFFNSYNPDSVKERVVWVTPPASLTTMDVPYMAYGNEATLNHFYVDFSLIVRIGTPGKRVSHEEI